MELYCLHYNNYYNRIIKKEDTIAGYLPYLLYKAENINFNPNDGVSTTQILNWNVESMPDYIVAVNGNDIISRWFIMEMSRTRTGQYSLILRRDLIADNYEPIINAPCFIEKATLNQDDPMIYNSEDMSFNQIKTSETLLKDRSESSWIVGYYAKDYVDPEDSNISLNIKDTLDIKSDIELSGDISSWEWYQYVNTPFVGQATNIRYSINTTYFTSGTTNLNKIFELYPYGASSPTSGLSTYTPYSIRTQQGNYPNPQDVFNNMSYPYMLELSDAYLEAQHTSQEINTLLELQGKVIKYVSSDGTKFVKVNIKTSGGTKNLSITNDALYTYMSNAIQGLFTNGKFTGNVSDDSFNIIWGYKGYRIELTPFIGTEFETKIASKLRRYNVNDQPYSMFAIPYDVEVIVKNTGAENWSNFITDKEISLKTAYSLIEKYSGAGALYDVQLLPYCPMQGIISSNHTIDLNNDDLLYSLIYSTNEDGTTTNHGVIINCTDNTFSLNIPLSIDVMDKKIENLTDMHRICSPNMNGIFEFSVAKNNGVDYINVDCEYRPYTPYIHLNPNFKGLYGQDFNGARGLICAGDFGLTQITDAWQTYQIQNKNYENIFNRQIQNMQVNNAVQKEKEIWSAAAGAVSAGTGGAVAGGMIGGPIGAVVGGLVSGGISAAAGARDIALNQRLRNEAIDYTKDQYGYQLGNIMALPDSITKVSSFNPNNKIFPFIEYYTCTDVEKEALRNKLKYNGMTVMRIGNIREFLQTEPSYIKGKLIRLEDISDEYHIVNEIANEIYKGVFI